MTEFDKIIWGFIISAVGITLGWILNQLTQWFRTRQEDKRNLKIVLYNLLETYHVFVRSDLDKFANKMANKVHSIIPSDQQTTEVKVIIQTLYSNILTTLVKPELIEDIESALESYQESIKTLAKIDPITAFYLNNKTNLIEGFDKIQNISDELKNQYPEGGDEIKYGADKAMEIIKPDILQDSLTNLEKDIKKIAWKINPYVWLKSIRAIRRLKINANERLDKEIDNLFDKLTPLLESNLIIQ